MANTSVTTTITAVPCGRDRYGNTLAPRRYVVDARREDWGDGRTRVFERRPDLEVGDGTWVEQMSPEVDPVVAFRVEGPAGLIYEVGTGTHRAHAARLFGLPCLLALVKPAGLPVAVRPADREVSAVWAGLLDRGVVQAEVSDDNWWYVGSVVGEWMLAAPSVATQVNGAYERVYPGALSEATGLTVAELTHPELWRRALGGRRGWWGCPAVSGTQGNAGSAGGSGIG